MKQSLLKLEAIDYLLGKGLNMPANLENSEVATEREKVSFHYSPKERQCQRMPKLLHNCTQLQVKQTCHFLGQPNLHRAGSLGRRQDE